MSLASVEFAFNNSPNQSISRNPFAIVFTKVSRHVFDLVSFLTLTCTSSAALSLVDNHLKMIADVHEAFVAQARVYKQYVVKYQRRKVFPVGDQVMAFLWKERRPTRAYNKLAPQCFGAFLIVQKINDNAYVLDISRSIGISTTFKLANLTPYYLDTPLYANSKMSPLQDRENFVAHPIEPEDHDSNGQLGPSESQQNSAGS